MICIVHVKDPVVYVRVHWVMEHPYKPACTKSVRVFQSVEAVHCIEEEEKELQRKRERETQSTQSTEHIV